MIYSKRHLPERAVEPSSGSNVILRLARPGLAGPNSYSNQKWLPRDAWISHKSVSPSIRFALLCMSGNPDKATVGIDFSKTFDQCNSRASHSRGSTARLKVRGVYRGTSLI